MASDALEHEHADRLSRPFDLHRPERAQGEEAINRLLRMLGERDTVRGRQLFHPLREADGVSLRGVVHAQVVADLADDHFARVQPEAEGEVDARGDAQLIGILAEAIAQMERRVTGALGVILVRDRRAEQRHDPVAGELVDEALEALDPIREDLEEAVHDLRPRFRVELLRQLHRAFHVGEQHGDLLALAFEGGLGLQDLLGEVFGRVGAGTLGEVVSGWFSGGCGCRSRFAAAQRGAASVAEPCTGPIQCAA